LEDLDESASARVIIAQAHLAEGNTSRFMVVLTKDVSEIVANRIQRDRKLAVTLLEESLALFLNGEPSVARLVLRDLVNATIGFEGLAAATGKPSKSLHRMLSAKGNPTMDNLAVIFGVLQQELKVEIQVESVKQSWDAESPSHRATA
jgi:DNA-binding phage protein